MNPKIRVAVIGAGGWGQQHARIFSTRPDTQLCALVGRSETRVKARAEQYQTAAYTNIQQMLQAQRPDLVSICLPNLEHFQPTFQVIQAGYPLLVEKPLVFDLAEANTLIQAAEKQGLFFAINFNHRYAKPVQLAREAIQAGKLGDLTFATWRFGGEGSCEHHPHANLIETQCHGLDMLEYLCGPIEWISAEMTDKTAKGYTTLVLSLRFANGAVGSLTGSYDSSYAYPRTHAVEINGTKGRVLIEDTVRSYSFSEAGSETTHVWQAGYFNNDDINFYHTFDKHIDDLLKAFVAGQAPPIHAAAGYRALKLAYAAIESFETGRRARV
jgi:myo-inositol 2-dehydrogenase / D-chiro-inositol 1-dehydrogenase